MSLVFAGRMIKIKNLSNEKAQAIASEMVRTWLLSGIDFDNLKR